MDPFATPDPSLKHKKSTTSSPKCSKKPGSKTWPIHQYMHQFPLPLRVFLLFMSGLWCLPALLVVGVMYIFWQMPRDLIRRRSRLDRGRDPKPVPVPPPATMPALALAPAPVTPSQPISATSADPKEHLADPKSGTLRDLLEMLPPKKNSPVISRDFAHNKPPAQVPLTAIFAQNRASPSLNSQGDSISSRRSSFSTDPVHDIVITEISCLISTTPC